MQPPLTKRAPPVLRRQRRWILATAWIAWSGAVLWAIGVKGGLAGIPWLGAALVVIFLAVARALLDEIISRRMRRRVVALRGAICIECGYDLSGVGASGTCPECGEAFTRDDLRHRWEMWYGWLD